jgi:hypothetical protein
VHDFTCNAKVCKGKGKNSRLVRRYLDTRDSKSTGSLRRHAKVCWGEENVARADEVKNIDDARQALKGAKLINGTITAVFERIGKGKISYANTSAYKVGNEVSFEPSTKRISYLIMIERK